MHYSKDSFPKELIELITNWSKALKIGKNDIAYYKQTDTVGSVTSLLVSTEDTTAVRMAYPIKEGDTKFPFDTSLFDFNMNFEFAVNTNALCTFWDQISKKNSNTSLEIVPLDSTFIPVSFMDNTGERISFQTQNAKRHMQYAIDYVLWVKTNFKITEFISNVEEDNVFQEMMKMHSADGAIYYHTPKGFILTLWPGLIKANKGDQVHIAIQDDPFHTDLFYVTYYVLKPKKHYRTETTLCCIQPKHLI